MIKKNRGQSLLEALLCFPVAAVVLGAVAMGIYLNLSYYLLDHWTQESALCLAKKIERKHCRKEFTNRAKLLVFTDLNILAFDRGRHRVFVKAQAFWPMKYHQTFTAQLPWPVQKL